MHLTTGSALIKLQMLPLIASENKVKAWTPRLFYTTVSAANVTLKEMIDSGSMACTLSEAVEARLLQCNPNMRRCSADDVVIIGCGGHQVPPKAMYDVEIIVYDCRMVIPMFVVLGQTDEMILGSNAIKTILELMRKTESYWWLMSEPGGDRNGDSSFLLSSFQHGEVAR